MVLDILFLIIGVNKPSCKLRLLQLVLSFTWILTKVDNNNNNNNNYMHVADLLHRIWQICYILADLLPMLADLLRAPADLLHTLADL